MGSKITVLMALYNGGEYLQQTVQSVLNQTYQNFEFLIINDCSTDDSLSILESFHDERIKVHTNVKNLGQTPSLNVGLKLAQGDYFARMDGDDLALPQWLEAQLDYIQKHPRYSVVSSYAFAIDEKNRIKKFYKPPMTREDIILRSLIAPPIHHVGSIFKKKDIIDNGGYDDRYIYAADYELWERLIRNNLEITTNPQILVAIREHSHSVSRSEHGRRDLEEIKELAGKNISRFVDTKFSKDEISLFCDAHYAEGNLTADEFERAVDITQRVYGNLSPSLNIKNEKKAQWRRQRCLTIYLKRIFSFIDRKDYGAVRALSLKAMKEWGPSKTLLILWGASLFGGIMLRFIPGFYNKMLRRKARLELGAQSNNGMFH